MYLPVDHFAEKEHFRPPRSFSTLPGTPISYGVAPAVNLLSISFVLGF